MLAIGCASNPLASRWGQREREPVVAELDTDGSESTTEDDGRPRSRRNSSARENHRDLANSKDTTSKSPAIDPATRMLIDSELKQLPAAERRIWKDYLASVSPKDVPLILQKRVEGDIPADVADQLELLADQDQPATSVDEEMAQNQADSAPEPPHKSAQNSPNKRPQDRLKQELDAPDPEIILTGSEEVEEVSEAVGDESSSRDQIEITLEHPDESEEESSPSNSKSASKTAPSADSIHANDVPPAQTAMSSADEAAGSDRRMIDQMRIWPQGKRPERKLLSGGHLSTLTPPWSRESRQPPSTKEPAKAPERESTPHPRNSRTAEAPVSDLVTSAPTSSDPKADYWQDELRKLISLMEAEAARPPVDDSPAERQAHIQRQVYLRMLYLMAAEPEKAQLPIDEVDAVDQEFWTSMFWGMSNYFDDEQTGDPGVRAAQTIAQLHAAARHLQSVADLELRNVGFCHRIDGWGLYERFDQDEFEPGQEILLYGELRNFATEATAAGFYRTLVSSTIEIVRTGQEDSVLDRHDLGETEDLCRGLRTDFYNSYRMTLPAHLTRGSYQLRLTVEDKLSGRLATQTIGFSIR